MFSLLHFQFMVAMTGLCLGSLYHLRSYLEIYKCSSCVIPKQTLHNSTPCGSVDSVIEALESILCVASDATVPHSPEQVQQSRAGVVDPHSNGTFPAGKQQFEEKLGVPAASQWSSFALQYKKAITQAPKNDTKKLKTDTSLRVSFQPSYFSPSLREQGTHQ